MTGGVGTFLPSYVYSYPKAFDPTIFQYEFVRFLISTESAVAFNSIFSQFKSLKILNL